MSTINVPIIEKIEREKFSIGFQLVDCPTLDWATVKIIPPNELCVDGEVCIKGNIISQTIWGGLEGREYLVRFLAGSNKDNKIFFKGYIIIKIVPETPNIYPAKRNSAEEA